MIEISNREKVDNMKQKEVHFCKKKTEDKLYKIEMFDKMREW